MKTPHIIGWLLLAAPLVAGWVVVWRTRIVDDNILTAFALGFVVFCYAIALVCGLTGLYLLSV